MPRTQSLPQDSPLRPLIVGLIGGIACGKSAVAARFAELGAVVLDADGAGHAALRNPEVKDQIRELFDDQVFDDRGEIIRRAVAERVFGEGDDRAQALRELEKTVHPHIAADMSAHIEEVRRTAPSQIIVLDAPVLLEAGWDKLCHRIVFVECPHDIRLARALTRGWTAEMFAAREAAQMNLEDKRARADYVLDNSGSLEKLHANVDKLWKNLIALRDAT